MINPLNKLFCATALLAGFCAVECSRAAQAAEPLTWHEDYFTAYKEAEREHKQLFIFFRDEQQGHVADSYEFNELTDEALEPGLRKMVLAVLPLDATIQNTQEQLLDHEAFVHQQHRQGIAVVDLVDSGSSLHGKVVSAHPFTEGRHMTSESTKLVLELPRGTITQRSLIYAARLNPYQPAGVKGKATNKLLDFAAGHCGTMCSWSSMHHSSYGGAEIVANLGSGKTIVDTAKAAIAMWQGSPPHWGILTRQYRNFGLDMKRSASGHWYATGVFSN